MSEIVAMTDGSVRELEQQEMDRQNELTSLRDCKQSLQQRIETLEQQKAQVEEAAKLQEEEMGALETKLENACQELRNTRMRLEKTEHEHEIAVNRLEDRNKELTDKHEAQTKRVFARLRLALQIAWPASQYPFQIGGNSMRVCQAIIKKEGWMYDLGDGAPEGDETNTETARSPG